MSRSETSTHVLDLTERRRLEDRLRGVLRRSGEPMDEAEQLLDALVEQHEGDRRRVIRELHDDALQLLTTLGRRLGSLRQEARSDLRVELMELEDLAKQAIRRLRRIMEEPSAAGMERLRLLPTLRARLRELQAQLGVGCVLQNRLRTEPPPEARVALLRIAGEALANVRKHARARRVEICLEDRNGGIRLCVRDDGCGFDPGGAHRPGHFGLRLMRERAELAGGSLSVGAAPGRGTTVECWLPVGDEGPGRV